MESSSECIRNYNVSVKEIDGKVIFLRKLVRGGSEHSFGIHVAKLAGIPQSIVTRATAILHDLESSSSQSNNSKLSTGGRNQTASLNSKLSTLNSECPQGGLQLHLFQLDDPVLAQIKDTLQSLDIDNLTPLAALNKLNEIKHLVGGK